MSLQSMCRGIAVVNIITQRRLYSVFIHILRRDLVNKCLSISVERTEDHLPVIVSATPG